MPGMSGLELQAKLNAEHCRIPTIFITAHGDANLRMQALRAGAVEFLAKPFDDEALLESVRGALQRRAVQGSAHASAGRSFVGAVATFSSVDQRPNPRRFEQLIV